MLITETRPHAEQTRVGHGAWTGWSRSPWACQATPARSQPASLIHACIRTYIQACMHTQIICVYMHTLHAYIHAYINAHIQICMHTVIHSCTHDIHAYLTCTYTDMHTHNNTIMHTWRSARPAALQPRRRLAVDRLLLLLVMFVLPV